MAQNLDPKWTTPVPSGRVTNPTGAITVRDRSFNRLLYPVLSNAITHRLRYLSFWCWVVKNTDEKSPEERALYEKLLLFASTAHDCDDETTLAENGLVGATRSVDALPETHPRYGEDDTNVGDLYSPQLDSIPLSATYTRLTNDNESGFEAYYRNWLKRLFLIKDRSTVTRMGEKLADAYADAHGVAWDRLETAVDRKAASQTLIQDLAASGCICSISEKEQQLCLQTWLCLFNRATTYGALDYAEDPERALKAVDVYPYLRSTPDTTTEESAHEGSLTGELLAESDTEKSETDLERYIRYGHDVSMRASQLLILHSVRVAETNRHVCPGTDHPLSSIRTLWRFHIQSEQFAWTVESLLGLFLTALQEHQPCHIGPVLDELTTREGFETAIRDALGGVKTVAGDGTATTFDEVKLGILYGENTTGKLNVRSSESSGPSPDSWCGLVEAITEHDSEEPFDRHQLSEWQLQRRLQHAREETEVPVQERTARACGYAAVLLARFQSRYDRYYGRKAVAPYRRWFLQTASYGGEPPNLRMIWQPTEQLGIDQSRTVPTVTRALLRSLLISPYLDRLYDRMESGQIPQHFTVDGTGHLRFERAYGSPSLSRLKYQRICDSLFELDLITNNRYGDFGVTQRGEQLLNHVLSGASA